MKRAKRPDWEPAWRKLRKGIQFQLRDKPPEAVSAFVESVGVCISTASLMSSLLRNPSRNETKRQRDLRRLKRATESYVAELRSRYVLAREFPSKVSDGVRWARDELDVGETFYRAKHNAKTAAVALLAEIDEALRLAKPRRRGQPRADASGLLAEIAKRYAELFDERPVSTLGGPFMNIATLVLENLHGDAPRDVSRQVRAAIKSI